MGAETREEKQSEKGAHIGGVETKKHMGGTVAYRSTEWTTKKGTFYADNFQSAWTLRRSRGKLILF